MTQWKPGDIAVIWHRTDGERVRLPVERVTPSGQVVLQGGSWRFNRNGAEMAGYDTGRFIVTVEEAERRHEADRARAAQEAAERRKAEINRAVEQLRAHLPANAADQIERIATAPDPAQAADMICRGLRNVDKWAHADPKFLINPASEYARRCRALAGDA